MRADIIDKVLLRHLPGLYGIQDVQELNSLFTTIAWNSGQECSINELSKSSGVKKTTLRQYLSYLEAAFLVHIVKRVDQKAGRYFEAPNELKSLASFCLENKLNQALVTSIDKSGLKNIIVYKFNIYRPPCTRTILAKTHWRAKNS